MIMYFKGNDIRGGVLNHAVFGNDNKVIEGDGNTLENKIYNDCGNDFITYLDEVIVYSDSKHERECALNAKKLYESNKRSELKKYLMKNISTFTSGTFATVAGGLLIELIKMIIG